MSIKFQLNDHPILYEKLQDHYQSDWYPNQRVWLDANYYFRMERWFIEKYGYKLIVLAPSFTSDGDYMNDVKRPYIEFDNEEQLLEFRLKLL